MATIVTRRIGAAVLGRDFATITAWEVATTAGLVAADQVQIGQAFDDAIFASPVSIAGATVDATRFRRLAAAPGQEYDPIADTGVRLVSATTGLDLSENFAQVEGFLLQSTGNGAFFCGRCGGDGTKFTRCVFKMLTNTTTGRSTVDDIGFVNTACVSCIAIGGGGTGAQTGFNNIDTAQHCIAYNMDDGLNPSRGFSGAACTNCLAIDCAANVGADYIGGSVTTSGASDATGSPAALDTLVAATIWVAPAANNFRPAAAWTAAQAGTTIAGITSDFAGNGIVGAHDVGAYEFPTSGLTTTVGRTEGRSIPRNFSFAGRHRVKSRPSIR